MREPRETRGRSRERVELSLDGRQIASIVVGALVLLGVVFVLGLNVGRQIARRDADAARGADALDALDRAPAAAPRPDAFTYHDQLTTERPAPPPPAAQPPAAPAPQPEAAASPDAAPDKGPAAEHAPSRAKAEAPAPAPAVGVPAFTIQLGAAQERAEADRLAARFRAYRPRVEEAEVTGKGRWYRVRVGAFETKPAAERYLRDLVRETGAKGFVTSGR